jgi:hypothetical protein
LSTDNQIKLPTYVETPSIRKDSMAGDGPFKASVEIQNNLGFLEKRLRIGNKSPSIKWLKLSRNINRFKFSWIAA